jgi:hypothetical protein
MKAIPASGSGRGFLWGPGAAEHPRTPRVRFQQHLAAPLPSKADLVLVTDLDGNILEVVGIQPNEKTQETLINCGSRSWKLSLKPNEVISLEEEQPRTLRTIPFNHPDA